MSEENLDVGPEFFEDEGYAMALIEQQRSSIMEKLRTARAVSVTLMDDKGDGYHWGVYYRNDSEGPGMFLLDAAIKAVRDLAAISDSSFRETCLALIGVADDDDEP